MVERELSLTSLAIMLTGANLTKSKRINRTAVSTRADKRHPQRTFCHRVKRGSPQLGRSTTDICKAEILHVWQVCRTPKRFNGANALVEWSDVGFVRHCRHWRHQKNARFSDAEISVLSDTGPGRKLRCGSQQHIAPRAFAFFCLRSHCPDFCPGNVSWSHTM